MRTPDSNSLTAAARGALIVNCRSDLEPFRINDFRFPEDLRAGVPRPLVRRAEREEGRERLGWLARRRSEIRERIAFFFATIMLSNT